MHIFVKKYVIYMFETIRLIHFLYSVLKSAILVCKRGVRSKIKRGNYKGVKLKEGSDPTANYVWKLNYD